MGVFSSSANVGDLLGTAIFSAVLIGAGAAWYYTTVMTAFTMALISILFALFGREHPPTKYRHQLTQVSNESIQSDFEMESDHNAQPKEGVGFFKAWMVPGVAIYACAFAFVKLVFYGMLMWLPYYVKEGLGRPDYDPIVIANLFDLGSVCGAII